MRQDLRISSVNEFLNTLFELPSISNRDGNSQIFWFRGESNIMWKTPLVPNSYRVLAESLKNLKDDLFNSGNLKDLERNINADFYRKSFPFIIEKKIENTAWNRYFLMQHYKIKTRLLDWTENSLLALFFAVSESATIKDDAIVWILQPFKLNNYTINTILGSDKSFMLIPHGTDAEQPQDLLNAENKVRLDELTRRYLRMDFENQDSDILKNIYHPLAIYPLYLDERMSAQKTCFTIFGNKINGLLSIKEHENLLESITIAGDKKIKILNELRLVGIDFDSIYPDLDGLGRSINGKYQREFYDNRETLIHVLSSLGLGKKSE